MIKKNVGIILFLIFCLLPAHKINAQNSNAGFVPGNIWYSVDPFEEGDKIKIYTLIFNPDARQLSGAVIFFDKDNVLGTKNFIVLGKSAKDISIDWTVSAGDHTIFGQIENAKFLTSDGQYENVSLTSNKTENSLRTVKKKIIPQIPKNVDKAINTGTSTDQGVISTVVQSIQNIEKAAQNEVPASVTKPIIATANTIEGLRGSLSTVLENKKEEIKNKINVFNNTKTPSEDTTKANALLKPFSYGELFLLYIFEAISQYKILFYGVLAIIIFLFARYLWHLIF